MTILNQNKFLFSGISAGLKESKKKDLGLIYCTQPCTAAAVFTQNNYPAPHIIYAKKLLPSENIQAIIVNSGQAMAGTGKNGIKANAQIIAATAKKLELNPAAILTSATGKVGDIPSVSAIQKAITSLKNNLNTDFRDFAEAILTTDSKIKTSIGFFSSAAEKYFVIGICKGSGMIAPNMATMLSYILTDYPFTTDKLQKIAQGVSQQSFNCLSVDFDTSTNDSFYLLSAPSKKKPRIAKKVAIANILLVAQDLAKQIAADAEGAEHIIELTIQRATSKKLAKTVLQRVLNSPLLKCAINGEDPNWGRILVALGNGLAQNKQAIFTPVIIKMQGITVFNQNQPAVFDETLLQKKMQNFQVNLTIDLLSGQHNLRGWGCDLSREYVAINADYHT